jgi:thiol-disulfide isomerase/thioredoxin
MIENNDKSIYNNSMANIQEYLNKNRVVKELKEKELLDLIAEGKPLVLKVWMDNCDFCKQFAPIFDEVAKESQDPNLPFVAFNLPRNPASSSFASKFMMVDGRIKGSAPATMLFFEGKLKALHYGVMNKEALVSMINTGEAPGNKKQQAQQELHNLFAEKGAIITAYEKLPEINKRINELEKLLIQG